MFAISNLRCTLLDKERDKLASPVESIGFNYSVATARRTCLILERVRLDVKVYIANLHSPYKPVTAADRL